MNEFDSEADKQFHARLFEMAILMFSMKHGFNVGLEQLKKYGKKKVTVRVEIEGEGTCSCTIDVELGTLITMLASYGILKDQ